MYLWSKPNHLLFVITGHAFGTANKLGLVADQENRRQWRIRSRQLRQRSGAQGHSEGCAEANQGTGKSPGQENGDEEGSGAEEEGEIQQAETSSFRWVS